VEVVMALGGEFGRLGGDFRVDSSPSPQFYRAGGLHPAGVLWACAVSAMASTRRCNSASIWGRYCSSTARSSRRNSDACSAGSGRAGAVVGSIRHYVAVLFYLGQESNRVARPGPRFPRSGPPFPKTVNKHPKAGRLSRLSFRLGTLPLMVYSWRSDTCFHLRVGCRVSARISYCPKGVHSCST